MWDSGLVDIVSQGWPSFFQSFNSVTFNISFLQVWFSLWRWKPFWYLQSCWATCFLFTYSTGEKGVRSRIENKGKRGKEKKGVRGREDKERVEEGKQGGAGGGSTDKLGYRTRGILSQIWWNDFSRRALVIVYRLPQCKTLTHHGWESCKSWLQYSMTSGLLLELHIISIFWVSWGALEEAGSLNKFRFFQKEKTNKQKNPKKQNNQYCLGTTNIAMVVPYQYHHRYCYG